MISGALTRAAGETAGAYPIGFGTINAGANYAVSYAGSNFTIAPATLTASVNNATKTYDGAAFAGGNGIGFSGFKGGDSIGSLTGTLTYGGTAQGAVNAGLYTLTASGLSSPNYTINWVPGSLTISPASLIGGPSNASLTGAVNNDAKVYDGKPYSGGNGVRFSGFVGGDTIASLAGTLTYGGSAQGAVNAGIYTLTASGLSSPNYTITWLPGTLTITKAPLTVMAENVVRNYDATIFHGGAGVRYSGFVAGENASALAGSLTYSGASQGARNVGTYAITPGGLSANNYALSFVPGSLSILPANLVITAKDQTKTFGTAGPLDGRGFVASGLLGSDAVTSVVLKSDGLAIDAPAGTYALTPSLAAGTGLTNYIISYSNAPVGLTVLRRPNDSGTGGNPAEQDGPKLQAVLATNPYVPIQASGPPRGTSTVLPYFLTCSPIEVAKEIATSGYLALDFRKHGLCIR